MFFRLPVLIKQMNLHHLLLLCKECHVPQQEKIFHVLGIAITDSLIIFLITRRRSGHSCAKPWGAKQTDLVS